MNKKLIAIAIAMAAPLAANAADGASVSGFADIIYTVGDDATAKVAGKSPTKGKFKADGEIDFAATQGDVTVRADLNVVTSPNTTGGDTQLEQAFFAWKTPASVTVIGGVFNNPIGADSEDAPDMNFTSHSVTYNILNQQTALAGNNVAGVAVAGAAGPVSLTGAILNDLNQTNEKNSLALVAGFSPMKDLNLELGYVSQANQTDSAVGALSAENVTDINATYAISGFTVGIDYLAAGKIVDSAYAVWGGYDFGNGFGLKARVENVKWTTDSALGSDSKRTTLYASYSIAKNLSAALEYAKGDNANTNATAGAVSGIATDKVTTLEFIAGF